MDSLFSPIVAKRYIRKGVWAYKHRSGVIYIEEQRYFFYSLSDAIRKWRSQNKIKNSRV